MEKNEYIKIGFEIGEKILAEMAAKPKDEDKLSDVIVGIIAMMKPRGVRVTLTLLESSSYVTDYMRDEQIDADKLKAAAALANKKWRAAEEKEETIILPKRRKVGPKAKKVVTEDGAQLNSAATEPDQAPLLAAPMPAGDENFVVDVPANLL